MTLRQITGAVLLVVPFATFTTWLVVEGGWLSAAMTWGIAIVAASAIAGGIRLLAGPTR
jgi:hypothetical protein